MMIPSDKNSMRMNSKSSESLQNTTQNLRTREGGSWSHVRGKGGVGSVHGFSNGGDGSSFMSPSVGGSNPAPASSLFFHHSQIATVGILGASLGALLYDQYHLIYEKYHITKKWLNLCGMLCLFIWLYLRPLIRRRLGSASGGYINWNSVYVLWLTSAFIYHLPSLESMGVDIKADISMLLSSFLLSGAVLGVMAAACSAAVMLGWLSPRLWDHTGTMSQIFATIVLNSFNLAVASSTYYSFCGNVDIPFDVDLGSQPYGDDSIRNLVCGTWLHPLPANQHSTFARWVLYGETPHSNASEIPTGVNKSSQTWERDGQMNDKCAGDSLPADSISPVFTAWLTILTMFCINWTSDYAASVAFSSAYTSEARRSLLQNHRKSRSLSSRKSFSDHRDYLKRSASLQDGLLMKNGFGSMSSLSVALTRKAAGTPVAVPLDAILKTVSSVGSLLGTQNSFEIISKSMQHTPSAVNNQTENNPKIQRTDLESEKQDSSETFHQDPDFEVATDPVKDQGIERNTNNFVDAKTFMNKIQSNVGILLHPDTPAPSFLPMFPWYSGTSADLLKTLFDLMVSVKLFLGRFDMRTMQAATAGGLANGISGDYIPRDGDGFTFENFSKREELWVDFVGDTGDGGNPTYTVARCMAAKAVSVEVPEEFEKSFEPEIESGTSKKRITLPRAELFIHGGDLAYPNPTDETYEKRLWAPYEDAFPPPLHVHPDHLVVNKPDLPSEFWNRNFHDNYQGFSCSSCGKNNGDELADKDYLYGEGPPALGAQKSTQLCRMCAKSSALSSYDGPCAFLVPGNHDWIDGLETFQRHVIYKGWLGGWLLPQEKSYFALHLPHGWWVLTIDLGLDEDIDMLQFSYFARLAEERMEPDDSVILVTHTPEWLTSWFWGNTCGKNLRKLVRGPLKGRARLHLAGDLHFYMRHSFKPYKKKTNSSKQTNIQNEELISPPASEISTPGGMSPINGASPPASICLTPNGQADSMNGNELEHQSLLTRLNRLSKQQNYSNTTRGKAPGPNSRNGYGSRLSLPSKPSGSSQGSSPRLSRSPSLQGWSEEETSPTTDQFEEDFDPLKGRKTGSTSGELESASITVHMGHQISKPSAVSSQLWWGNTRASTPRLGGSPTGSIGDIHLAPRKSTAGNLDEWEGPPPGWRLNEPEHLVVVGIGGGFLHPTHVFSYSRFRPVHDPAAGSIFVAPQNLNFINRKKPMLHDKTSASPKFKRLHSSSSLYSLSRKQTPRPAGGEYRCSSCFPSPDSSLKLGRRNLHTFRHINSRFDIIGGAFYYLLVVSVLPRCSGISKILDAHSIFEALFAFGSAALETASEIFDRSYCSLGALMFLFIIVLGFARNGGVGAIANVPAAKRRLPEYYGFPLAVRARLGGVLAQIVYAGVHALAHFSAAICLLLLLELGIEMVIRAHVGDQGYHSLFKWYQEFESEHFPDPAGLRATISSWSMGLYPSILKWLMAFFDVPEAIAVARTTACGDNGSIDELTRLQTIGLYGGYLLYFWMLATPTVGFLFGLYLYISVNWLHLHYDEAFSALQTENFKGFLRFHVRKDGSLECFSLGLPDVSQNWREDPLWNGPDGGGPHASRPSHQVEWPSRWVPVEETPGVYGRGHSVRTSVPPEAQLQLIDHFVVHKNRYL